MRHEGQLAAVLEGEGANEVGVRDLQSNPFVNPSLFQEHPLQSKGNLVTGDGPRAGEVFEVGPGAAGQVGHPRPVIPDGARGVPEGLDCESGQEQGWRRGPEQPRTADPTLPEPPERVPGGSHSGRPEHPSERLRALGT